MFHAKFLLVAVVATLATSEHQIEPRIAQGHNAVRGQFPFFVRLAVFKSWPVGWVAGCGGSLISNLWIITSGHCVQNAVIISAHLGFLRTNDESEPGRKIVYIEKFYEHPQFSIYPYDRK